MNASQNAAEFITRKLFAQRRGTSAEAARTNVTNNNPSSLLLF